MNLSDTSTPQAVDQLIQDLEDGVSTAEDRVTLMDLMRQHASVYDLYLFRGALSEPQIRQLMEGNRVESLTRYGGGLYL